MTPRILFSQQPVRGWLPWGLLVPLLAFGFMAVPSIAAGVLLELYGLMDARGPVGAAGVMALLVTAFPLIALITWAWVRGVEKRTLDTIGLVAPGGARRFVHGHLIGVGSVLAVVASIALLGGYQAHGVLPAFSSAAAFGGALLLLIGFAVQSSVEEIVFRGWMLSAVARKFNLAWAVALSSLIFCLLHYSPGQFWLVTLNLLLFGGFTCAWALRANGIWGVMGWHAGWNWLLATGFQLPVTGIDLQLPALLVALTPRGADYLTGGSQGPEGSVACTVFLVIAIVILRRKPKPA